MCSISRLGTNCVVPEYMPPDLLEEVIRGLHWMKEPCIIVDAFERPVFEHRVRADYDQVMALPLDNPRMNDDRREIHEQNNAEKDWSMQAFILKMGNLPLGKHFHRKKIEIFFIIEGRVERLLTATMRVNPGIELVNRREYANLGPGSIIVMPVGVAHTFYMSPNSKMLCYSGKAFNQEDMDMVAVDLS